MNLDELLMKYDHFEITPELISEWEKDGPLTDEQLDELTLTYHYIKEYGAGFMLLYTDHDRLVDRIPNLLEYLEDMNWPAAKHVAQLLINMGRDVIPHLKDVFKIVPSDDLWLYWIINSVIYFWEDEWIYEIKDELIETVKKADRNGASILSLAVLKEKEIIEKNKVQEYFEYLSNEYEDDNYWLNDLKESLAL